MNDDLKELLALLKSHEVEFLVIGAHALAFHGKPRFTEDLDLWVNPTRENARRLQAALEQFGASIGDEGARRFAQENRQMVRIGTPPNMVDILNFAGGIRFAEVLERSGQGEVLGVAVRFPASEDLIEMKRAANRAQDIADIHRLQEGR